MQVGREEFVVVQGMKKVHCRILRLAGGLAEMMILHLVKEDPQLHQVILAIGPQLSDESSLEDE